MLRSARYLVYVRRDFASQSDLGQMAGYTQHSTLIGALFKFYRLIKKLDSERVQIDLVSIFYDETLMQYDNVWTFPSNYYSRKGRDAEINLLYPH